MALVGKGRNMMALRIRLALVAASAYAKRGPQPKFSELVESVENTYW
jgi:hypothetical protein